MHRATDVVEYLRLARLVDDHIGLIQRLIMVERHREQSELTLVLHIRIVAYPGCIELPD